MAGRPRRRQRLAGGEVVAVERRHGEGCLCVRCVGFDGTNERGRPFQPGHTLSTTHGCYSLRLADDPRTLELATWIRDAMPLSSRSDEVTITLLSVTLRRVERAVAAIEAADAQHEDDPLASYMAKDAAALRSLREDVRLWIGQAAKLAGSLGLNPLARSRLGLNVARAEESVVVALQREAREREAAS